MRDILSVETDIPAPQQRATQGAVSVALGVAATGCATATVATTTLWLSVPVLAMALLGFTLGYSAHKHALADTHVDTHTAIAGQVLNIVALVLTPCWGLVRVAMVAV